MARRKSGHASAVYKGSGGAGPNVLRAIVIITCVAAVAAVVQGFGQPASTAKSAPESVTPSIQPTAVVNSDGLPTAEPPDSSGSSEAAPLPAVPRIGVVAGHWGFDQGASCPDGLDEVDVNLDVAQRVVQSLRALGYQVDLLEEYDSRLPGYLADALVSIHADSCERFPDATPPPTGFKVASVVDSVVPEEEQRLVACLREKYGVRTGLVTHDNSITGHMTRYHTFYEIDGRTPGAIIETGFLWLDRDLLTQRPDLVAQGIVDGIVCFIEGN
jgi:N-acetylmuramoyl-L-alanine amidase